MLNKNIGEESLRRHKKLGGKIEIRSKMIVRNRADLSLVYTPGVGTVSSYLAKHNAETRDYTMKGNTIAVVSDGSAVLGLGNIGPEGAIPVMEGKAMLFKEFAGVNAVPLVLATQDEDEIVATVERIAPVFGGINLEDISAPRCFSIEDRLKKSLSIPVMHDDQHGTAIVALAALINAFRVAKKSLKKGKIAILGAGAAGVAVAKLLMQYGAREIVVLDRKGIIDARRGDLVPCKRALARITNPRGLRGGIAEALLDADAVIGVSGPRLLAAQDIRLMGKNSIVLVMANPIPEIMPDEAKKGGAFIVGTGRSDFPNQINNSPAFPGIFRGALGHRVRAITDLMKLRAAEKIAKLVMRPTPEKIVPDMFDTRVVKAVASAIR